MTQPTTVPAAVPITNANVIKQIAMSRLVRMLKTVLPSFFGHSVIIYSLSRSMINCPSSVTKPLLSSLSPVGSI